MPPLGWWSWVYNRADWASPVSRLPPGLCRSSCPRFMPQVRAPTSHRDELHSLWDKITPSLLSLLLLTVFTVALGSKPGRQQSPENCEGLETGTHEERLWQLDRSSWWQVCASLLHKHHAERGPCQRAEAKSPWKTPGIRHRHSDCPSSAAVWPSTKSCF